MEHTLQFRSLCLWICSSNLPHVLLLKYFIDSYWIISKTEGRRLVCGPSSPAISCVNLVRLFIPWLWFPYQSTVVSWIRWVLGFPLPSYCVSLGLMWIVWEVWMIGKSGDCCERYYSPTFDKGELLHYNAGHDGTVEKHPRLGIWGPSGRRWDLGSNLGCRLNVCIPPYSLVES